VPPEKSQTAVCYDAARGVGYPRPRLRGVLHQVSFAVSLVAGPLLLTAAHGTTSKIAAGVYAASVTGMFAASALYHRIRWRETARRRMQRLDHAMIFILIAGTYTPVLLLRMPTPYDAVGLCAVWGLALAGLVGHMCWLTAPERLRVAGRLRPRRTRPAPSPSSCRPLGSRSMHVLPGCACRSSLDLPCFRFARSGPVSVRCRPALWTTMWCHSGCRSVRAPENLRRPGRRWPATAEPRRPGRSSAPTISWVRSRAHLTDHHGS
jgi:hypothetical protein